eukprot:899068-Pelagomonas_calceolata.AAC.3
MRTTQTIPELNDNSNQMQGVQQAATHRAQIIHEQHPHGRVLGKAIDSRIPLHLLCAYAATQQGHGRHRRETMGWGGKFGSDGMETKSRIGQAMLGGERQRKARQCSRKGNAAKQGRTAARMCTWASRGHSVLTSFKRHKLDVAPQQLLGYELEVDPELGKHDDLGGVLICLSL